MWSFISLLTLGVIGGVEEQAETLLGYASETQPALYSRRHELTFDNKGNLWLLADWVNDGCVLRIRPDGKEDLERLLLLDGNLDFWISIANMMDCDRWGNLYCGLGMAHVKGNLYFPGSLHLFRVTPEGETQDYHPWPDMRIYETYMEILQGDTLVLMNYQRSNYDPNDRTCRISKALVDSLGITPVLDKTYSSDNFHPLIVVPPDPFYKTFFDWNRGFSFYIEITDNIVETLRFDLKSSENSIPWESLDTYNWRNHIWRTFEDTWIGWLTLVDYKDGRYLLCISDPEDRSITHIVRLNHIGEPIVPSTFKNSENKKTKKFDKMPSSAKPYVEFQIWDKPGGLARDSAQVLFWACDDEGNLYTYRAVRKY